MSHSLDNPVLVLNRHWQPVNICSARRAIGLIYVGHALVVDSEDDFLTYDFFSWSERPESPRSTDPFVHSVSVQFPLPQIIVLSEFDRFPKKEIKFTRENVFHRDKYTCQYCHRPFEAQKLNLDHVVPRERGGQSSWENVVASCIPCNTRKANRTPQEAKMRLKKEPKAPRWQPLMPFQQRSPLKSWRHFVDVGSWEVEISA